MEPNTVTPRQSLELSVLRWISWKQTQKPNSTPLTDVLTHAAHSRMTKHAKVSQVHNTQHVIRVDVALTHSDTDQVQHITKNIITTNGTERVLDTNLTALRNTLQ